MERRQFCAKEAEKYAALHPELLSRRFMTLATFSSFTAECFQEEATRRYRMSDTALPSRQARADEEYVVENALLCRAKKPSSACVVSRCPFRDSSFPAAYQRRRRVCDTAREFCLLYIVSLHHAA
jgi:hypothetical protein